jgi:RecB family exonuclease
MGFSRQSGGSVRLPPAFFVKRNAIVDPAGQIDDPYQRETRFFSSGSEDPPEIVFSLQRKGISRAAAVPPSGNGDRFTSAPVTPDSLTSQIMQAVRDRDGNISLTPTDMETYFSCAFRFLLEKYAGLSEREYTVTGYDRLSYGTFIHRVFERFFRSLLESQPEFSAARLNGYRGMMADMIAAEEAAWKNGGPLPIPPLWRTMREQLIPGFTAFLEQTAEHFDGMTILHAEHPVTKIWKNQRTALSGTLDLLVRTQDGPVLIDYKTKNIPGRNDMLCADGPPASFQIPCYLLLADAAGTETVNAAYYSFEHRAYTQVCHPRAKKRYFSPEEMKAVMIAVQECIFQAAELIRAGDFTGARTDATLCRHCTLRMVCRKKYHLLLDD